MSGFTFKGYDFNEIVSNGTVALGNYKKKDGTALSYGNGSGYSKIDPTTGDISQAFKVDNGFPANAGNGSQTTYYSTSTSTTVTAPAWARAFKVLVYTRKGSTAPKIESSQGGQRGPNTGQAGNYGIVLYSNTYTPIGGQRNFNLEVGNGDNSFSGIYQSNVRIGANAGGHGQAVYEAHTNQSWYYTGSPGPNANRSVSGTNATITEYGHHDYLSLTYVYWFS